MKYHEEKWKTKNTFTLRHSNAENGTAITQ